MVCCIWIGCTYENANFTHNVGRVNMELGSYIFLQTLEFSILSFAKFHFIVGHFLLNTEVLWCFLWCPKISPKLCKIHDIFIKWGKIKKIPQTLCYLVSSNSAKFWKFCIKIMFFLQKFCGIHWFLWAKNPNSAIPCYL